MKTFFKIITAPIWLPFKILWVISKVIAFVFLLLLLGAAIYIYLHFFY